MENIEFMEVLSFIKIKKLVIIMTKVIEVFMYLFIHQLC